jgi:zinc transporter 1/2/3
MPVGVLVGLVMTELGTGGSGVEIANGLLQAVAMGTFIYVTFFEILQEEVDPDDTSLAKIAFIAVGFTLMALLDLIPEEQIEQLPTTLHTNLTLTSTVSY